MTFRAVLVKHREAWLQHCASYSVCHYLDSHTDVKFEKVGKLEELAGTLQFRVC